MNLSLPMKIGIALAALAAVVWFVCRKKKPCDCAK